MRNKLASTASRFHADEIEAQRGAARTFTGGLRHLRPVVGAEGNPCGPRGPEVVQRGQDRGAGGTPARSAYDTTTPLSLVGGALGREKRGGASPGV